MEEGGMGFILLFKTISGLYYENLVLCIYHSKNAFFVWHF